MAKKQQKPHSCKPVNCKLCAWPMAIRSQNSASWYVFPVLAQALRATEQLRFSDIAPVVASITRHDPFLLSTECFDAIATALSTQPHQLPTPLQVLSEWQRTARGLTAQQYFLERGGSVELALALVIDSCCHDEQEWDLSSINRSDAEADDEEDWQGPGPGPSFVGSQPARGVTAGYYPAAAASSQGPSFVGSQPGGRTAGYAASSGVAGGGGFNLRAGAAGSDVLLGGWSSGGGADAAMGGLPASGGPGAPLAFLAQLSGLVRPAVSLPRCVNDCNYSGVFEALLGTKTPRRLPGCHACGLPEDDEVQSDGFDD